MITCQTKDEFDQLVNEKSRKEFTMGWEKSVLYPNQRFRMIVKYSGKPEDKPFLQHTQLKITCDQCKEEKDDSQFGIYENITCNECKKKASMSTPPPQNAS